MSAPRILAVPLVSGVVALSLALSGHIDVFSGTPDQGVRVEVTSEQPFAVDAVTLPAEAGPLASPQPAAQERFEALLPTVDAPAYSTQREPRATDAAPPGQAPAQSAAEVVQGTRDYVDATQAQVAAKIEAAQEQAPAPSASASDFAETLRVQAQSQAGAIRQQAQSQIAKSSLPVQPLERSLAAPGCSMEQEALPNGQYTTVRCFQESKTGTSSNGSVSAVSSSVSITTSSSVTTGSGN